MHNLAIALKNSGCIVSGSDDKIYNPSRDRLLSNNLLPEKEGWFPDKITKAYHAGRGYGFPNSNSSLVKR